MTMMETYGLLYCVRLDDYFAFLEDEEEERVAMVMGWVCSEREREGEGINDDYEWIEVIWWPENWLAGFWKQRQWKKGESMDALQWTC